jgi:hypothetical protein
MLPGRMPKKPNFWQAIGLMRFELISAAMGLFSVFSMVAHNRYTRYQRNNDDSFLEFDADEDFDNKQ